MNPSRLPSTWAAMTATEKLRWLHSQPDLRGIDWKQRTRKFHVWGYSPSLGCSVSTSGVRTIGEAIELRDRLQELLRSEGGRP